jgi:hypothetical protein
MRLADQLNSVCMSRLRQASLRNHWHIRSNLNTQKQMGRPSSAPRANNQRKRWASVLGRCDLNVLNWPHAVVSQAQRPVAEKAADQPEKRSPPQKPSTSKKVCCLMYVLWRAVDSHLLIPKTAGTNKRTQNCGIYATSQEVHKGMTVLLMYVISSVITYIPLQAAAGVEAAISTPPSRSSTPVQRQGQKPAPVQPQVHKEVTITWLSECENSY